MNQDAFTPLACSSPINNRVQFKSSVDCNLKDINAFNSKPSAANYVINANCVIEGSEAVNDHLALPQEGINSNIKQTHKASLNEFWLEANKRVRGSGRINAEGCKIKIPTDWDLGLFDELLAGYKDREFLTKYMTYGWPIEAPGVEALNEVPKNQKGARQNTNKLKNYVRTELQAGTVIGPFDNNPLGAGARFSPLDALPKKDSDDIRVILNLSYPVGGPSVNAACDKKYYLNRLTDLHYPGVDDMIRLIKKKGRGSLLFKMDLKRFYRQIVMDPGSIHLLGFSINGELYFDVVLSMGLRIACFIGQAISSALMYIYRRLSYEGLNYLDDLGGVDTVHRATAAFLALSRLLGDLNIREAVKKACKPAHIMIFLGIRYNTITFTIELTQDRFVELKKLLGNWVNKHISTLKEAQSLLGKLNFACATVRSGRVFLARLIEFIKSFDGAPNVPKPVPETVKKDVTWWKLFMKDYDGKSFLPDVEWSFPDAKISTDSCLTGCGGWAHGEYFHKTFPEFIFSSNSKVAINELELIAIMIAVKIWGPKYKNHNLWLHCDNQTSVDVINKGYARNSLAQKCLREIAWHSAKCNV